MRTHRMTHTADALVIGGGPGGSTIATLLRRKGWRVVLCEKEHHPRFHVGESLLPLSLPVFARLGVLDQVKRIGVLKYKYGADFSSHWQVDKTETVYWLQEITRTALPACVTVTYWWAMHFHLLTRCFPAAYSSP